MIFTFSIANFSAIEDYNFTLNWETSGIGVVSNAIVETRITVSMLYQNLAWIPIYTISAPEEWIDRSYGWYEYSLPAPLTDYISEDELKIMVELSQDLTEPRSWTQSLYVYWLLLEIGKDLVFNSINATQINIDSAEINHSGDVSALHAADGNCFTLKRTIPSSDSGHIQFSVTYDLGCYGGETLQGLRFPHLDWVVLGLSGSGSYSYKGKIYLAANDSTQFLCYIRDPRTMPLSSMPSHAITLLEKNWTPGQHICLLYDIEYNVHSTGSFRISVYLDWARLQIVRGPQPILHATLLNHSIYTDQEVWLNISCFDGKAPITEIRLTPWGDLIAPSSGFYLFSRSIKAAGEFLLTITIRDADYNLFIFPDGS